MKICSRFTGEHPCRSAIFKKFQSNFIEITLRHGCSPVNLLHIFRTPFLENSCGGLFLHISVTIRPKLSVNKLFIWHTYIVWIFCVRPVLVICPIAVVCCICMPHVTYTIYDTYIHVLLLSLLLTLKRFPTLFWCFHYSLWTNKRRLGYQTSWKWNVVNVVVTRALIWF